MQLLQLGQGKGLVEAAERPRKAGLIHGGGKHQHQGCVHIRHIVHGQAAQALRREAQRLGRREPRGLAHAAANAVLVGRYFKKARCAFKRRAQALAHVFS